LNRLHHPALRSVHVGFTFTAMSPCPVVDPATFAAADAMQAAYFRGFLDDERRRLVVEIANREAELVKRTDAGQLSAIGRLRAQISRRPNSVAVRRPTLRTVERSVRSMTRSVGTIPTQ
jgi:hypothetical protein